MRWPLRLGVALGAAPSGAAALFVWFAARGELQFVVPTLIVAVPVLLLWCVSLYALLRSGVSSRSLLDVLSFGVGALLFIGGAGVLYGFAVHE